MPFDLNQAKGHLRNLGYEDNSDEMKALLGFASMLDSGGDRPQPVTPTQGIIATLGAGAQAGLARLGGADHNWAVTEAMQPINRLMKVNDEAFARSKEINAALGQIALKDRFSTIAQNRADAKNKAAADAFGRAIYGDGSPTPAVSAPVPTITPPAAQGQPGAPAPAPVATPSAAPAAPAAPAAAAPGIVVDGGTPAAPDQVASPPTPTPAPTAPAATQPAASASQAAGGSQFDRMMSTLKTPQAKRHFQIAIASIQQQMASGNMKDGATIDAAYKAATDIDRQTLAQDPEFQANLEQAKTEGKKRGEMAADKEKSAKTVSGIGEIMDTLETLGQDKNIGGAIGPVESNSWIQSAKGMLGSDSYDLNQKINAAKNNLQLIMTRLMMSGQGNISEGERTIVNEAIGRLEASKDQASYLDNVRYLREMMSGIFGMNVPSQYNVPSSMKARVSEAMKRAQEINKQNAENTASDGTKLYAPENAPTPRDESQKFNPRGAPSASSVVMPAPAKSELVGAIRTLPDGRQYRKIQGGWEPILGEGQ